jgi:hypothetical protein
VGVLIVLVLRLGVPLLLLRRPLAGAIASIVADTCDILVFNLWGWPPWPYHQLDKALDLYYLTIELWVSRGFPPLERRVAGALFAWRAIGVLLLEALGWRAALIAFPNVFEWWFLLVLLRARWRPGDVLTPRRAAGWLLVLLVPKLGQEYALHVARWLDQWNLTDVARSAWSHFK